MSDTLDKDLHPDDSILMIEDPYQIRTLEIAEAQRQDEELELDQDLLISEDPEQATVDAAAEDAPGLLESIARAMEIAEKAGIETAKIAVAEAQFDSQAELARQIAEDEALTREMDRAIEQEAEDPELLAALPKEPQVDDSGELDLTEVQSCVEALLFMTDKPMPLAKLQELLGPAFSTNIFQEALTRLVDRYQSAGHGFELVQVGGGYQFRTKPGRAALAKKLARIQVQRLSSGAMETLAIIAYKQPAMKEDVDKVRGVDSSHFIRGLLDRKLVEITGRSELPGRPMLYATTQEFLALFGLKDLAAMPPLRELEQMIPTSQASAESEDPRVREMRRLVSQMKADGSTSLKYDPREDEKILKEIREKVNSIETSTPYLEEQKALEKRTQEAASLLPSSEA